jgi:hypothetical protein
MSVYGRLGYNFDSTQFNGADTLSQGVLNYLGNTSIRLSSWQIDDMSNSVVGGYYKNPHQYTLASLSIYLDAIYTTANTANLTYSNAPDVSSTLLPLLLSTATSMISFTTHTNNLAGVTRSSNTALYPDLGSALAVGRQILNITNTTDSIQNNTPILGNFTSLYTGNTLSSLNISIINNYITLNNSISIDMTGNAVSNISNSAMNMMISDIQTLQILMDTRRSGDWTFYQNSLAVMQDYQTVLQFSNLGATQNSLITLIGTNKLHSRLGY